MPYTDVDASQKYALGTRSREKGTGNEFIYLKGVTGVAQGSVVVFDEVHVTALADSDTSGQNGRVAVAVAAVDASTKFGWFQIYGKVAAKVAAAFADGGAVSTTSTGGTVDDAATGLEVHIFGMYGRSAIDTPTTGQAWMELNYPHIEGVALD